MEPLVQPRRRKEPAVSKEAMGKTSWTCQCCVMACHTPILPTDDKATNCDPMKNRYSTATPRLKVPVGGRNSVGITPGMFWEAPYSWSMMSTGSSRPAPY